jgi:predicted MPP superfamily phosphohydrolase
MNPYYKKGNTDIYISGGIGNRDLNIRLLNNPSINFFRIRKEQ